MAGAVAIYDVQPPIQYGDKNINVDLATNLIVAIVIGLSGFAIGRAVGFDLERVSRMIGLLSFAIPLLIFMLITFVFSYESKSVAVAMVWFFANNLPGVIIGDAAALATAKIASGS
jgi:hypothetical protein